MSGLSLPYDLPDAMSTAFDTRTDRSPLARRQARIDREHRVYLALISQLESAFAAGKWAQAQTLFAALPDQLLGHPRGRALFIRAFSTGRQTDARRLWDRVTGGPLSTIEQHAA